MDGFPTGAPNNLFDQKSNIAQAADMRFDGGFVLSGSQGVATAVSLSKEPNPGLNPTVVIADDHAIVREGIRRILTRMRPTWNISGEAANGVDAVKLAGDLKPSVVVLDITMPGMTGLEAARQISRMDFRCRILIFTVHHSNWLKGEIRDAGAHGYVQKSQAARDLITAIECLLRGGIFFPDETEPESDSGKPPV